MKAVDYRSFGFYKILSTKQEELSVGRAAFVIVTLVVMITLCFVSALHSGSAEQRLDNLRGMQLTIMTCLIAINECVNYKRMTRFVRYIDECHESSRYGLPEESTVMSQASVAARKKIVLFTTMFVMNFPFLVVARPIMEALNGHSWKQLPIPWTVPSNDNLAFSLALLIESVATAFSHCLGIVAMCFSAITVQIIAVYDIIILGVERIEERAGLLGKKKGLTYQKSMEACLVQSVAHQQDLFKEVLSVKPHLDATFFAIIVNISIIMALEMYPLVKEDVSLAVAVKGVVFLAVQIFCLATICNGMEDMSERNTKVFDALYGTPWYQCGTVYRRIILNGMTASRRPLTVRGSRFLGLEATRATFYSAMVSTFNMLNLIRKVG